MNAIIQKINELQKKINSHKPFDTNLLATWQEKLRIDWTYNSNAIEGNTLTYGEAAFFLREGLTSEGRPFKDYVEAKNHAEAIDWLNDVVSGERKLTEGFIKELHALLMKDIDFTYARGIGGKIIKKPLVAGQYKVRPNHVLTISGKIHKYAEPIKVPEEMENLLRWLREDREYSIVEKAIIFHYKFVAIHPFDDGNGRMARLLMNLILMKASYPPCVIKNIHRKKYLEALSYTDETKDYGEFVEFVGGELVETQNIMLQVLEGKEIAEPALYPVMNRIQRREKIVAVFGSESLAIGQILEKLPNIKRPTLKSDLTYLVNAKKIRRHGKGKGAVYEALRV